MQRTQGRLAGLGARPGRGSRELDRGQREHRLFGQMRVARGEALDPAAPDPGAQPIDQRRHCFRRHGAPFERELGRPQRLQPGDVQTDQIEAEARIDRIRERADPLAEQAHQRFGRALRLGALDGQAEHPPVAAIKPRDERAPAPPARFEQFRCLAEQFLNHPQRIVMPGDRLGEAPLDLDRGRRAQRIERFRRLPQQPIEPIDQPLAEPCGERRGGAIGQIADRLEPRLAQRARLVRVET